jgi:hypothetical protein
MLTHHLPPDLAVFQGDQVTAKKDFFQFVDGRVKFNSAASSSELACRDVN